MGSCWFVVPARVRLHLSGGNWIEVKRQLSVGEHREAVTSFVGTYKPDGSRTPNAEWLGFGQTLAYLVDWSLRDPEDRPTPVSLDALKRLSSQRYAEIDDAIEAHIARVAQEEADEEKKVPAPDAPATSPTS